MYNGVLPFGATKGEDEVPVPHSTNHAGLVLAFSLAAEGRSDREIAQAMNEAGYRTSGNRGANALTKDSVRPMLQNRFYLGELPLDDETWMVGKHAPMVDSDLFERAQAERARNRQRAPQATTAHRRPWGLSGVGFCACGAPLAAKGWSNGRQRVECSGRVQGLPCSESSFYAADVEDQVGQLLAAVTSPMDQQVTRVKNWQRSSAARKQCTDGEDQRKRLETRRARGRELYLSGEIDHPRYQTETSTIDVQLSALPASVSVPESDAAIRKLADT